MFKCDSLERIPKRKIVIIAECMDNAVIFHYYKNNLFI